MVPILQKGCKMRLVKLLPLEIPGIYQDILKLFSLLHMLQHGSCCCMGQESIRVKIQLRALNIL